MKIDRCVHLPELLAKKSLFLFGPRQTGKSWLIEKQLAQAPVFNLLESDTFAELNARPQLLRERIRENNSIAVIDEIQKIPNLLDEVHLLIERKRIRFLLTGSSARALKRKGANLLGGRARSQFLHPLSWSELKEHFQLEKALNHGLLPSIYFSDDAEADLRAYVGDYLKEEIAAEGQVRNLPVFGRFLHTAAYCHGRQLNYEKAANDARIAATTVRDYFQILRDTLLGYNLPPWGKGKRRKEVATSKFYFFDPGVARRLQNRPFLNAGTPEFGEAFEAFLFHELKTFLDYKLPDASLSFWRTHTGQEVDFLIGDSIAVEVKASTLVRERDLKGLYAIRDEGKWKRFIMVSRESAARRVDHIDVLPWKDFLSELWTGKIVS